MAQSRLDCIGAVWSPRYASFERSWGRRARSLRRRLTYGERALWSVLRDRRAIGVAIRRQHPIGPYVVDFACCPARIAIELDGASHLIRQRDDPRREEFLRAEGWDVIHVTEGEAMGDAAGVAGRIVEAIERRMAERRS